MRFLSLFSGIEAASVAWIPLGWQCVGVAEIEPFPSAVLAHHYPDVPNLGDITKITEADIKAIGHIDLIVGGFPCQDLSIAGKRKGLMNDDGTVTRSGLFYQAMQIVRWANPRWTVVENVPGLFSSNKGFDFASVVGEMVGCGFDVPARGWAKAGVAVGPDGLVEWVTLDAQYIRVQSHPRAVPQRRRRVFLVRDTGDWQRREPLFLVRESLLGHPAPSRKTGQAASISPARRAAISSGRKWWDESDIGATLRAQDSINRADTLVAHFLRAEGFDASEDGTGRGIPLIPDVCGTLSDGAHNGGGSTAKTPTADELSPCVAMCLNAGAMGRQDAESETLIPTIGGAFDDARQTYVANGDKTGPLDMDGYLMAIAAPALTATNDPSRSPQSSEVTQQVAAVYRSGMQVRRLTPVECERLQGFPDHYTLIPVRGKVAADGNRYKALGNSFAVNVVRWIGERIQSVNEIAYGENTRTGT